MRNLFDISIEPDDVRKALLARVGGNEQAKAYVEGLSDEEITTFFEQNFNKSYVDAVVEEEMEDCIESIVETLEEWSEYDFD